MDFRDVHCAWCMQKKNPIEDCVGCPRYRKYGLEDDYVLDAAELCSHCRNYHNDDLRVFCETNRHLQQDSDEPFDCYKFTPDLKDSALKKTHVVTVFLAHKGKICLVRRSSKVGTFQGRWSGISGYLEGDPAEHYQVEIREETSLNPGEYTLLRSSDTVVIRDEENSRLWCVHPFLCEVKDPARITLDWENTEYRWIEPGEMGAMETVPGLMDVYERVSRLPVDRDIAAFTKELRSDRESGARQLAYKVLDFLARLVKSTNAAAAVTLMDDLCYACHEIGTARPSMAIISTTLELLLRDAGASDAAGIQDARTQILGLIRKNIKEMDSAIDLAVDHLDEIIPAGARVLVHSYSSSLIHALPLLRQKQCSLVATESRPGFEGRTTASLAADMGIPVRLVTDACAGLELEQADVVLMGADTIEQSGSVVNKAGSSLIAAAAHAMNVKVYFIGEIRKIRMSQDAADLEEYEPQEVWAKPPQGVEIRNPYFDRTSSRFISGIILEKGIVEPDGIMEIARAILPAGCA